MINSAALIAAVRALNPRSGLRHKADDPSASFDPLIRETEVLRLIAALKAETPEPPAFDARSIVEEAFDAAVLGGWMDIYDAGTVGRIREVLVRSAAAYSEAPVAHRDRP